MKKIYLLITLLLGAIVITGCTTVVDATTKKPIESSPSKRTFGTFIDDERLEVIAGVNINKAHPDLRRSNIKATSYNGVLLLTGQAPNDELRLLAGQTTAKIKDVRQVHNEIKVNGNTAFLSRTSDSWLVTKVRTVFITNKKIDSGKVKIVVEDGTVYLMGLVTRADADHIAGVTSRVGGVKEVVRVFEFIDA